MRSALSPCLPDYNIFPKYSIRAANGQTCLLLLTSNMRVFKPRSSLADQRRYARFNSGRAGRRSDSAARGEQGKAARSDIDVDDANRLSALGNWGFHRPLSDARAGFRRRFSESERDGRDAPRAGLPSALRAGAGNGKKGSGSIMAGAENVAGAHADRATVRNVRRTEPSRGSASFHATRAAVARAVDR